MRAVHYRAFRERALINPSRLATCLSHFGRNPH
jgi:hypothetical protein